MSLHVLRVAGLATLQDAGRTGVAHLAIPAAGAFDAPSHNLANRIVGNRQSAATIELLRPDFEAVAGADMVLSVTGAPADVRADGQAAAMNAPVRVPAGTSITIRHAGFGMRTYVAARGGWTAPPVLGSVSYDELARIGTPPLAAGTVVAVGGDAAGPVPVGTAAVPGIRLDTAVSIRVHKGPRWDFFPPTALADARYQVSSRINRVGVRLEGTALPWDASQRLASEGAALGSVQVPVDGVPLIFGPDHPTTAGYPVIAVVWPEDMATVAQLAPGTSVRFSVH